MKLFTCRCNWSYVIGEQNVYGPIFEDASATYARIMTRDEFTDFYGDCDAVYLRQSEMKLGTGRACRSCRIGWSPMICAWCAAAFSNTKSRIVFWPAMDQQPRYIYDRGSSGVQAVQKLWDEYPLGVLDIDQNRIHSWAAEVQIKGTLVCTVHAFAELEHNR